MKVLFTGHRRINITPMLEDKLIKVLEMLIKDSAYDYYSGGAIGWNFFCVRMAERKGITIYDMADI